MKRKIIFKVHDLDFENNRKSVEESRRQTILLLKEKGYFFDGLLISINTKIAYAWKYVSSMKPKPIKA